MSIESREFVDSRLATATPGPTACTASGSPIHSWAGSLGFSGATLGHIFGEQRRVQDAGREMPVGGEVLG